jgi:hypothetical protein
MDINVDFLIEHTGSLYFVDGSNWKDIHHLKREKFEKSILFLREENIEKSARLVDLFKDVISNRLSKLYEHMIHRFEKVIVDLAWNASDNLVEREIHNIEHGRQLVFPKKMLAELNSMRRERSVLVENFCKKSGGNLATPQIFPERIFSTLSSGEKRRLICTLSMEMVAANEEIKLLILYEPLAHLDSDSIQDQIQAIPACRNCLILLHYSLLATLILNNLKDNFQMLRF